MSEVDYTGNMEILSGNEANLGRVDFSAAERIKFDLFVKLMLVHYPNLELQKSVQFGGSLDSSSSSSSSIPQ